MATNTSGGTTTSFMNTPQAVDDYYAVYEDCIYSFDVMCNDLGGNAKILWSIDDTAMKDDSGTGTYDLLSQDTACVPELSDKGARIWIESGKIRYDASVFNYLGAGQSVCDKFTYAIRMSNGTLSWATVTITISGTNDGPDIRVGSGDTDSAGLNETNAGLCKSGTLTVTDPDTSDTVSTTFALTGMTGPAGGLSNATLESMFSVTPPNGLAADVGNTNNLTWKFDSGSEAFNYLRAGQTLQLVYTLTVKDGHGGTDTQTVAITITGTNDVPVLSDTTDPSSVAELGDASAQNLAAITGSFSVTDKDVGDTLTASVVGSPVVQLNGVAFGGAPAALTASGAFSLDPAFLSSGGAHSVGYSYDPGAANLDFLRQGDSLTITYTVQVGDGTTTSGTQTVTFTITGTNDAPDASPVTLAAIAEDSGARVITTAELLAGVSDVDNTTAELSITSLTIGTGNGSLIDNLDGTWTYTPALNDDTSVTFNYTVSDGSLSDSSTASLDITPVNDAPDASPVTLAAIAEDSGARVITTAELLAGVSDVDNTTAELSITSLTIGTGNGSLIDNLDGTWTYTPALNDDTSVTFNYTVSDGSLSDSSTASLDITPVNDAPDASPVTLAAIAEDSGARVITTAELLAGVSDVDNTTAELSITSLTIGTGNGSLIDNLDGTWTYTPALNDDTSVTFNYTVSDGSLSDSSTASLDITPVNDAPDASPVTLAAIAEDSGARVITTAELLAGVSDVDNTTAELSITSLTIGTGNGSLIDNLDGTWTYTPALNDDTSVTFNYTVSDGSLSDSSTASLDITPVNDAPDASPVTLAAIAEDSGARVITTAELLAGVSDVDNTTAELSITSLTIGTGNGSLIDNLDGTWTYTPALNDDTSVTFNYTVSDGSLSDSSTASLDITPVNDAPDASPVTLAAIAEDSGARVITTAELLAGVSDVDNTTAELSITSLTIGTGNGSLIDNLDGTWTYTPALNDDTSVTFNYTVSDGSLSDSSTASLDITPVNDAPDASPVTLAAIAEDSGARVITTAELLAGVSDVDNTTAELSITSLTIGTGNGSLIDNLDGTWTYTPALNDDTSVTFNYTVSDGSLSDSSTASLDITPVNDAPDASPVTLAAIAEDSGARVITTAELLAGVSDVDNTTAELSITSLTIGTGNGSLIDNLDGTWTYTPALNDDTSVTFNYTVSDGSLSDSSTASLDITPVNDAPDASPVTLAAIAEDSGARVITTAELLAGVSDVDNTTAELSITSLTIGTGNGSLIDNLDGTWTYTPALNDDTSVTFNYTVSDGSLSDSSTASLDITPVNDAPDASPVTLAAIAEDSGARVITTAELLAGVSDVDNTTAELSITSLTIGTGNGSLIDNLDGTWTYTPALNDDTSVTFNYTVSDGSLSDSSTASLDITPVNDAPDASPVTLAAIAEDSGARVITTAELLAGVSDVDNTTAELSITSLTIGTGNGSLIDNLDGTWTYTPALNDDTSVTFNYTVSDGSLSDSSTASLDITPVNDAPDASPVTLAAIAEDSGARVITTAELLAGVSDVDNTTAELSITSLTIGTGNGSLIDNLDGTWTYTPALNDDTSVTFNYTVSDGSLSDSSTASLDITPVNDAPDASPVTLAAIAEDSGARVITTAELLAGVSDVDNTTAELSITSLTIGTGNGSLIDNLDGTWTYTPALNDDTSVTFNYTVSDGSLSDSSTASLDITPVNDAPVIDVNGANTFTVNGPAVTIDPSTPITDGDSTQLNGATIQITVGRQTGDVLNFVNQNGITGSYNASTGLLTLTGTATLADYQTALQSITFSSTSLSTTQRTVSFQVTDTGNATSAADTAVVNVVADTTGPTVVSETITSATGSQSNFLNAGDVVSVTVTMSEVVNVTGTPRIALNIGGSIVQANYASGSGTNSLVFTYTILAGQNDPNGISINANALNLNGGTIRDASNNNAVLTSGAVGDNGSFLVDTTAPTVTITAPPVANGIGNTTTVTFQFSETVTGFDISDISSNRGTFSNFVQVDGDTYTATLTRTANGSINATVAANSYTDVAGNLGPGGTSVNFPAGVSGEPINLGLDSLASDGAVVTVVLESVPDGWVLNGGSENADGTWTVQTTDVSSLTLTTPSDFTGAAVVNVTLTWTNADGSVGSVSQITNVEAFAAGNPIFAWSGDDTLTGSASADLFVFSQPIGADTIHNFDASADRIDLIGYGVSDYSGLAISDTAGGALVDLGNGQSILLDGVSLSSLTAANFVFDVSPTLTNSGSMIIGDGAMLPLSGTIENSGTISLQGNGEPTVLELIQFGITLQGGGNLVLSDSSSNVISGTLPTVTFTNVDNVISGAGQLGGGSLTLINGGTIVADGGNALVIDTGVNAVTNTGTIEATGLGGLQIVGSIANSGTLLADGSSILIGGNLTGSGDVLMNGISTVEFGAGSSNDVTLDAGASGLIVFDDADGFSGSISGLDFNDQIDLRDVVFDAGTSMSFTDNGNGSGVLTITDATHSVQLVLVGDYRIQDFILASNGQGGSLLTNNVGDLLFP